jgi:ParB family transcriptional regulator, chromosome partitioning protein
MPNSKSNTTSTPSENTHILVNCSSVKDNPFQARILLDEDEIKHFAESLAKTALLNPITITRDRDNKGQQIEDSYILVAGQRRLLAYQHLNRETIPAIVLEDIQQIDLAILSLEENLNREELSYYEIGRQLKVINNQFDDIDEVIEKTSIKKSQLFLYISIGNIPIERIRRLNDFEKELGIKLHQYVYEAVQKLKDKEDFEKLFKYIQAGDYNRESLRAFVNAIIQTKHDETVSPDSASFKALKNSLAHKNTKTLFSVKSKWKDIPKERHERVQQKYDELVAAINGEDVDVALPSQVASVSAKKSTKPIDLSEEELMQAIKNSSYKPRT